MKDRRSRPAPGDLSVTESDDGSIIILSFALDRDSAATLSPAESEVARYLLEGRSNAEIASQRGSSARTVANQVSSLFRKLGVSSRLELVAFAPLLDRKSVV